MMARHPSAAHNLHLAMGRVHNHQEMRHLAESLPAPAHAHGAAGKPGPTGHVKAHVRISSTGKVSLVREHDYHRH
jgi:hypothetical protein